MTSLNVGPLQNARQEAFARNLAKGMPHYKAYMAAGYTDETESAQAASARLLGDVRVKARVETLQERATKEIKLSKADLLRYLDECLKQGKELGQTAACVAAVKEMGILAGIRVERQEHAGAREFEALETMSAEELRQFIRGLARPDPSEDTEQA